MRYCEIVRDIAAKLGDWLYYDEQFRFIRQSAPAQYPWDAIYWEIWLKCCDKFSFENPIFLGQGTTALPLTSPFQEAHAGVSMWGRCATGAVSNTFAVSVAQNTPPHSVPPANIKHTSSKQAFQTALHKPVTPVKVDRLNFLLSGYETSLPLYLVNGFTFGFLVGFDGECCALHSPNLKSALDQPQIVRTKLRKDCEAGRICGPFIYPPFPNFVCSVLP